MGLFRVECGWGVWASCDEEHSGWWLVEVAASLCSGASAQFVSVDSSFCGAVAGSPVSSRLRMRPSAAWVGQSGIRG